MPGRARARDRDRDGDWKGGHLRIGSDEPTSSVDTGTRKANADLELRDVHGDDAYSGQQSGGDDLPNNNVEFFKVYKRRWFGLVELTLLNLLVSWQVSLVPPLSFETATP